MRRFIYKVIIYGLTFFILEKLFIVFLFISPKLEKDKRLELLLKGKINKEIIIFGSSRGARNIMAGQIQDSLKMSSYNLSYPGSDIEFHEFLLRTLLIFNDTPKLVILSIDDPEELIANNSLNFRLDRLYPLSKYNYINNELINRGNKTIMSKAMILARINKRNFDIRKKKYTPLDSISSCGSMPISFQRNDILFSYDNSNQEYVTSQEVDSKIIALKNFQKLCNNNNIELLLVFSPNYKKHNILLEERIKEICKNEIKIFVYDSNSPIYLNKNYYYDETHLLKKGAESFTNDIIRFLKKINIQTE